MNSLLSLRPLFSLLCLIPLLGTLSSCSLSSQSEEKSTEPIAPAVESKIEPATEAVSDPLPEPSATSVFRMLKDDNELPTDAQLSDGAGSSIENGGAGGLGGAEGNESIPSATIKPPQSAPEDQLAPSE